jgi:outer membrane protein assembly factor BamA
MLSVKERSFVTVQRSAFTIILLLFTHFLPLASRSQGSHRLVMRYADSLSEAGLASLVKTNQFESEASCKAYLNNGLLPLLRAKGYLGASLDSINSGGDSTLAWIYLGMCYTWGGIEADSTLLAVAGNFMEWHEASRGAVLSLSNLQSLRERFMRSFENNGYPFARFEVDSGYFIGGAWYARMRVVSGPFYRIDSLTNDGSIRLRKRFLQQHLGIAPGAVYRQDVLEEISNKLQQLGFLKEIRPWELSLLGTGAVVNLHLDPLKSNRLNLLAGIMPDNQQLGRKLLITGEADFNLQNIFSAGESLQLKWQQIQVNSPRLQLSFAKPYLFKSPLGLDFKFNLLKKDSSFLTISSRFGLVNGINKSRQVGFFLQQFSSFLINPDTTLIQLTRKLPPFLDLRSTQIGLELSGNNTRMAISPRKGWIWQVNLTGGIRQIIRNDNIVSLTKDAQGKLFDFASLYDTVKTKTAQGSLKARTDRFFLAGRQSTIRLALQTGWLMGAKPLRNELFQVGGINTLRGFDEESIFASGYFIGTMEYRYHIAENSHFFVFTDGAYVERRAYADKWKGSLAGFGMGLTFETKSGLFSLVYAAGKREGLPLNWRESKIHFGFVSLF